MPNAPKKTVFAPIPMAAAPVTTAPNQQKTQELTAQQQQGYAVIRDIFSRMPSKPVILTPEQQQAKAEAIARQAVQPEVFYSREEILLQKFLLLFILKALQV